MTHLALVWLLGFTEAPAEDTGSAVPLIIVLAIFGGVFYFFMILPQRRRMRALQAMRDSVEVGDEIRTIGGIKGTVRSMDDEEIVLDVGGGVQLNLAKRAIAEAVRGDEA